MRHFDLAIIGTGSGNSLMTPELSGLDVALIEHGTFGGTCLNVGCIPTKMYVYAADVADLVRRAHRYGVDASIDKVRWTDIRDRVFGRIDPIATGGETYRVEHPDNRNVTVYRGTTKFVDTRTLDTGTGETITADRIVVAAGSRPSVPPELQGIEHHTSDTIMRIDELPQRLVICGGGYIAAEFAHVFGALGVDIRLVTRGPALLRAQDESVSERFTELAGRRWDVHLNQPPRGVERDGDGYRITLRDGTTVDGDMLLVASGRIPNTDLLDAAAGGIDTHPDGRIVVDAYGRTSVDGVFALGDVSSAYQLKHVANHEARVVAHNLAHPDDLRAFDHRFVPSAVFTDPQVAAVGRTEQQCRAEGLDYVVKQQAYGDVAYGWAMEDTTGFCKVIAERGTGRLLGAHIIGPQASTVIQPLIQAMSFGLDARQMATGQYWIHPALPEVVENALLGLEL